MSRKVSTASRADRHQRKKSDRLAFSPQNKEEEVFDDGKEEDLIYGDSKFLHRNHKHSDKKPSLHEDGDESEPEPMRRNRRVKLPRYIWNGDTKYACYSELMISHFRDLDRHLPMFRKYADNNEVVVIFRSLPNLDNFMKTLVPPPETSKMAPPFFRTIERYMRHESSKDVVDVLCGFMRLNPSFTAHYFVAKPYDMFYVRMARLHLSVNREHAQKFYEIRPDLLNDNFEAIVEWTDVRKWILDMIYDLRTCLDWISVKHGIELDGCFEQFVRRFITLLSPRFEVQSLRARVFLNIIEVFIKTNATPYSDETIRYFMLICATLCRAIPEHYADSERKDEIQERVFVPLRKCLHEIKRSLDDVNSTIKSPAQKLIDQAIGVMVIR
ncbi:unnamed protein product [Bursaphelenchus okinawaensis]|uniref:Uncharacterized protein n=1 Tax=Bursaphelenchus okinawaensis TaxID=465554 RepID=A0A811L3F9_9BILA|nr:unnamed protein product [Bursaphelenchus okinawaensis]CAG9115360.1 unnamed protein product [Bursaphelenchus okinawaensis]